MDKNKLWKLIEELYFDYEVDNVLIKVEDGDVFVTFNAPLVLTSDD